MSGRISNVEIVGFLKELADRNNGILSPEAVVKAARPAASPIHDQFEWNNTEAARRYRLIQAGELIRVSVEVIAPSGCKDAYMVRAFTSLTTDRKHGAGSYRATVAVLSSSELRKQMLADALAEMEAFEKKYDSLKELAELFAVSRRLRKTA